MAAFRTTFEEMATANILLHIHDASNPEVDEHAAAVDALLTQLGMVDKPTLHVLNKADKCDADLLNGLAVKLQTLQSQVQTLVKDTLALIKTKVTELPDTIIDTIVAKLQSSLADAKSSVGQAVSGPLTALVNDAVSKLSVLIDNVINFAEGNINSSLVSLHFLCSQELLPGVAVPILPRR